MKYNQYSYIPVTESEALEELQKLDFSLSADKQPKDNLEQFLKTLYFQNPDFDEVSQQLIADFETDLLTFFHSQQALTDTVFQTIALQLLGFIPHVDFEDSADFCQTIAFPITFDRSYFFSNLHQLLACRRKNGMTLIDDLISQDFLPADNDYHFFNGKSLATFETSDLIREIVYVEAPVDTDKDGRLDVIKVYIIRPKTKHKLPSMMTASPYHQGINESASDKRLHQMEGKLEVKTKGRITVETSDFQPLPSEDQDLLPRISATESFSHIDSYSLNDYFLARGFANLYVSGVGTLGSDGFMTSGDYAQIHSFKAVIDWLNGKARAFSSRKRDKQVLADWASGLVATTGKSYLGTMSTGLATTGVDGLRVIIAEAAISNWYDYYRENGLVCSPGGYPGEDLDVLTELTYSRNLAAGDYLHHNHQYQALLEQQIAQLDRSSGDYNQFWEDRNYLPHANQIKAHLVFTHGLQDWNVKPSQVYKILNALPEQVEKHAFLHQGEHVYMHNWQSIDFRESMNALLTKELLGLANGYQLPAVIWQDNAQEQNWETLTHFGSQQTVRLTLGDSQEQIDNHYPDETFKAYCQDYLSFKKDLFDAKANQITVDLDITEELLINGAIRLQLKLKSSHHMGILSAQLLDLGKKKRLTDSPHILEMAAIDNGRNFSREALKELAYKESPYRVITKSVLNLQNRQDLLTIDDIIPDQWMTVSLNLLPTIYRLKKHDKLRLVLYTTDFEHTIRDNSSYSLTVDLKASCLDIPHS